MHILFFSSPDSNLFSAKADLEGNTLAHIEAVLDKLVDIVYEHRPQLIFIGGFALSDELLSKLQIIYDAFPNVEIALCVIDPEPDFLMRAIRTGVREVIGSSTQASIKETVARVSVRAKNNKKLDANAARIIGFMSAKGGDGSTCIAANIASALAKHKETRILVIDFSLPFGDIEMFLTSQKQTNDLADFSDEIDRLDASLMDSMVEHVSDNLHLIASPLSVDRLIHIKPAHIDRLIEISSTNYDYIIIDIGAGIDPISIHALAKLHQLIVVATMTVPSLKRATQVLRYWQELGLDENRLSIAVNRFQSKADIKISDIEKAMGRRVVHYLPQDNVGVQESLLKGIPLIDLKPNSEFTKSIFNWASEWSGKVQGKSLWQRLKNR